MTGYGFPNIFFELEIAIFFTSRNLPGAAALVVGTSFVAPTSGHLRVPHPKGWCHFHQASGRNKWNFSTYGEFPAFLKDFRHIFPPPKKTRLREWQPLEKNNHHNHHFWKKAEVIFNRYQKSKVPLATSILGGNFGGLQFLKRLFHRWKPLGPNRVVVCQIE